MSNEQVKAAQDKLRTAMDQVADAMTEAGNATTDMTTTHALHRMAEAQMLLGLASGVPHKMHPNLHALHIAVNNADKQARMLLDIDVDVSGLSPEAVGAYIHGYAVAENAYNQWRCLSALALMHLSSALDTVDKKGGK